MYTEQLKQNKKMANKTKILGKVTPSGEKLIINFKGDIFYMYHDGKRYVVKGELKRGKPLVEHIEWDDFAMKTPEFGEQFELTGEKLEKATALHQKLFIEKNFTFGMNEEQTFAIWEKNGTPKPKISKNYTKKVYTQPATKANNTIGDFAKA